MAATGSAAATAVQVVEGHVEWLQHFQHHQQDPYDLSLFDNDLNASSTLLDTSIYDTTTTNDITTHSDFAACDYDDSAMMQSLRDLVNETAYTGPHHEFSQDAWSNSTPAISAPSTGTTSSTTHFGALNSMSCSEIAHPGTQQHQQQPVSSTQSPLFGDDILFPSPDPDQASRTQGKSNPSPRSGSGSGTLGGRASPASTGDSPEHDANGKVRKRQRNTEAARRYRQRKVDKMTDVEEALAAMTKERDELKLKLARSEAEADVLRAMMGKRS